MCKKPFNWIGFILVCIYLLGLFLFGWGIYQCKINPQSAIIKFFGGDVEGAIIILSLFGGFFLVLGGIFVVQLYKKYAIKTAFKVCPELKSSVKAVSRMSNVYDTISASQRVALFTLFFISFEFPDGSRKNFRIVNADVFNMIVENDTGILTYKEHGQHTLFIGFQRQS